ncbi:MAG: hypothetical protein Ct9H300mP5_3430 [Candidatus Pelagibacterales bacterium]|nr:MAG: hypothetical protein Ct9H300mP5_3430 [Pelagibacterales bacterium]
MHLLDGYLGNVQVDAYYVAGRTVPTVFNGMALQLTGCQVRLS